MTKKILVVLTATEKYPSLNVLPAFGWVRWFTLSSASKKAGFAVDYVTPNGGYTPIDPHSLALAEPIDWEWYRNRAFMNRLGATLKPSEVNHADYVGIYFVGGHGVLWDFPITRISGTESCHLRGWRLCIIGLSRCRGPVERHSVRWFSAYPRQENYRIHQRGRAPGTA